MKLSADCMYCLVEKQRKIAEQIKDETAKSEYIRDVLRIVANAADDATAPLVVAEINALHRARFGTPYSFEALKREYNTSLLQKEAEIEARIGSSADPLLLAVKFARAGNYIDFGAMSRIDDDKLNRLLEGAEGEEIDSKEYASFVRDLEKAKYLAYLTDNCGEIVLDKLLIRTILSRFPGIYVTAIVRGEPVLNDATSEDAGAVGLSAVVEVMGNGTDIAGTQLDRIGGEARRRIGQADVIISKGQGNFETLHGCGLNIYYMFLCKCDWFVRRFGLARHEGVFVNERNVRFA